MPGLRHVAVIASAVAIGIVGAGCGSSSSNSSSGTTAAKTTTVPAGHLGGVYGSAKPGRYAGRDGVHSTSFAVTDGMRISNLVTDEYVRFGTSFAMHGDDGFEAFSADKKWQVYGSVLKGGTAWVVTLKYLPAPDNKNLNWQMSADPVK